MSEAIQETPNKQLTVRHLGLRDYETVWHAMQEFTDNRDKDTCDEIWFVEHHPVFTQGQAGKAEHLLMTSDIPVVKVDRGGQITYHGPGQLVAYFLMDIRRLKMGVRDLVTHIEQCLVELLKQHKIDAYPKPDAPGVYVGERKIASLGLRIRKGCSFHGLALNVDMDLTPFRQINPCGYAGMEMVQMNDLGGPYQLANIQIDLMQIIANQLGFKHVESNIGFTNDKN